MLLRKMYTSYELILSLCIMIEACVDCGLSKCVSVVFLLWIGVCIGYDMVRGVRISCLSVCGLERVLVVIWLEIYMLGVCYTIRVSELMYICSLVELLACV